MDKLVRPVFTLELNYKIIPGLVTLGKYDGTHPCVTAATSTDKILIHSPHRRNASNVGRLTWSETNREIATLNINQSITALATGPFLPNDEKDILIIGTSTHILVYHVHDNKDIFYKECEDGVKSVTIGSFKDNKSPIVMVGGNSSIRGYDHTGNEIFWTAVGDVITSMVLMDYDKDGMNELVVSAEDFNIRVFKGDQVIAEHVETEVVTNLIALPENRFAYSVSNGTLGVYEQDTRLWRVKSKNFAISMTSYDLLGQSSMQLVTGWSNGKVDCRAIKTGEVLFKDSMNSGIAGLVEGDYRSIGKADLICVASEGEVRGYTTTKTLSNSADGSGNEQDVVRELLAQKQSLLMELKHYENNMKYNENILNETESYENSGVIPASTRLQIAISTNDKSTKPHVEVYITTNNSTILRAVIIFAEGIFKGETHVVHPPMSKLSSELCIPLILPKDNPVDIHIKNVIWEKIAQTYNSATTEPRTSEQLRGKYDNLKKDVRKYEAQKKQNMYKTGGGSIDPDIKAVMKLLYDKIKSLISFSVDGLEPSQGDSDVIVEVEHTKTCSIDTFVEHSTDYSDLGTLNCDKISDEGLPSTSQTPEVVDFQDWSNYTPKMLKSKKHKVLQVKRKKMDVENNCDKNPEDNLKLEMFHLKKELLQKEAARDELFHDMRMKKEEELYALKIKNQMLQNEKLEIEISILKKQLG